MMINKDKINDVVYLDELVQYVEKIVFHNDTNEAYKFFLELKQIIYDNEKMFDKRFLEEYQGLIIKLRYVLFFGQSEEDILELLEKHLVVAIKIPYFDFFEMLKKRISFIVLPDRDEYKKKIMNVLLNNKEIITSKNILIGEKKVIPTVSAWLNEYNRFLGTGLKNNLEQSKFFINNKNFINLDDLERLEIKELFYIYEYLKRSSTTLEGNEDNMIIEDIDGGTYILQDNRFIDLFKNTKNHIKYQGNKDNVNKKGEEKINDLITEEKKYSDNSLQHKVIEEEIKKEEKIKKLQIIADGYKKGSLERKAVLEEMEMLEKK